MDAVNKLCKWRMVLAGWHQGTKSMTSPGTRAMRDLMDKWLIMRVEGSAVAQLLIKKGLVTEAEFLAQRDEEARALDLSMEALFPGFRTTDDGVTMYDTSKARETMQRLGFPP